MDWIRCTTCNISFHFPPWPWSWSYYYPTFTFLPSLPIIVWMMWHSIVKMMIVRSRTSSSYYYLNYYWQFLHLLLICWMLAMYHWIQLLIGVLGGHHHHRLTTMTIMTPQTHREDIAQQGSEMWKVMVAVCIASGSSIQYFSLCPEESQNQLRRQWRHEQWWRQRWVSIIW